MIKEDKLEMLRNMRIFCGNKTCCSNCPVEMQFPNHECGCGKWYDDDEWAVSDEELELNHAACFGEKTARQFDSFKRLQWKNQKKYLKE